MSDSVSDAKPSLRTRWTTPTEGVSASGNACASPLGQWAWASFEGARNPHVLLITIYIFAPYFYISLVGDPVRGQALWGDLNSLAGLIIAIVAPVLGAVADAGGRRKPWLAVFSILLAATAISLWWAVPDEKVLSLDGDLDAARRHDRVVRLHRRVSQRDAADAGAGQAGGAAIRAWRSRSAICRA